MNHIEQENVELKEKLQMNSEELEAEKVRKDELRK